MRVPGSGPSYSTLALPSYTRRRLFILRILVPAVVSAGMAYGQRLPLKLLRDSTCCSARRGVGARWERGADSSRTPVGKQSKHLAGYQALDAQPIRRRLRSPKCRDSACRTNALADGD